MKVHLALNTLIKDSKLKKAVKLAILAYNLGVDAIIIQDLGLASYLRKNYPEIPLHASTQMTVHNLDGVKQLVFLGFSRVVLARELSLDEIKYNTKKHTYLGKIKVYNDNNMLYESNIYLNTDIEYYNFYLIGIILIILLFIIVIIWKIKRKKRRRRKRR